MDEGVWVAEGLVDWVTLRCLSLGLSVWCVGLGVPRRPPELALFGRYARECVGGAGSQALSPACASGVGDRVWKQNMERARTDQIQ